MQHGKQGQWKTSRSVEGTYKMTMKVKRRKLNTDIIHGLKIGKSSLTWYRFLLLFSSLPPCEITNGSVPVQS